MADEREQLEQAIANIEAQRVMLGDAVADTTLAALREKLAALTAQSEASPTQRKQVTVLFADISGYTAMSEVLDAEEVADTVKALWQMLDAIILQYGGKIDKHIGDAVMALFGVPTAQEDDVERAIRAGLTMQRAIAGFTPPTPLPKKLQMRIGINTGPVLMSPMGSGGEYTAMGDAVNIASRLESAAPLGGVLISASSEQQVRGIFTTEAQKPLKVKGKREPLQAYLVSGEQPRSFRVTNRGVEGVETRMVGRDVELAQLQAEYRATVRGGLQMVTVVAEAGMGKSRLLHEFGNWIETVPERVWWFKARADQQTTRLPYAMMRELLSTRFDIRDSDTAAVARQKLVAGVTSHLGASSEAKAHFIGQQLGLDFSDSPHLRGIIADKRQIHDRAFLYLAEMFTAAASSNPVAMMLDDLQWADDGSLDMVEYIAQRCATRRILISCFSRPTLYERRPNWGDDTAHCTRLDLNPLSATDCHRLVANILRELPTVPDALQSLIAKESEGNPFYLEELIKVLIDDGVIVKQADGWQVAQERLSELRVPPTLTAVLQARLDSLAPAERETLQQASVVGREFWDDAVQRLRKVGDVAVASSLAQLSRKDLVYPRQSSVFVGAGEYTFKHVILRDVTYESVLLRLRRQYHAEVAAWLIERSGERVGEYAGTIGDHFENAGDHTQAAQWYLRAAQQAQDTYVPAAAIDYYRKVLQLLPVEQTAERINAYYELGRSLIDQARYVEASEVYIELRDLAQAVGDVLQQMRAWEQLAAVYDEQGDYTAVLNCVDQVEALATSGDLDTQHVLLSAISRKSWTLRRLGRYEPAMKLAKSVLVRVQATNDTELISKCLNLLGDIYLSLGDYDTAMQYLTQAQQLYQQHSNLRGEAVILNNMGWVKQLQNDYLAALQLYSDALNIVREIGYRNVEMLLMSNMGAVQMQLENYAEAEALLRDVIAAGGVEKLYFLSETYSFLAQTLLRQGRHDEALAAGMQALTLGESMGSGEYIGGAWYTLALLAVALNESISVNGRSHSPSACFAEALRVYSEINQPSEQARTLREWAKHERTSGHVGRAEAMEQQAENLNPIKRKVM